MFLEKVVLTNIIYQIVVLTNIIYNISVNKSRSNEYNISEKCNNFSVDFNFQMLHSCIYMYIYIYTTATNQISNGDN